MSNKQKNIVVIPGSYWQIPIVNKIKAMGHKAYVVNPYEESPAFLYADGHLQADMFDEKAVTEYCRRVEADGIISDECDIAMPALARYGEILGLPTLTKENAHLFTDKFAMRDFCKLHGLPYPEYRMCYTKEEAKSFLFELGKKLIMKPLDSNSSRGVFTIEKESDIDEFFDEAMSYSRIQKAVLLERFIEGVEFTIDGIKTPSKHYSLAISEKKHFAHNKNIASELYFTHENKKFDYDLLRRTNDAFVDLSNLKFGLTHAEYKYEDGKFYLIEIAARGGGNRISSDIVSFMSGVDNYEYLIQCYLGSIGDGNFSVPLEYSKRAAVLKFFETPKNGGVVKEIRKEHLLSQNPDIKAYSFNFKVGDTIEPAKNDAARVGYYIACCENEDKLKATMSSIEAGVEIVLQEEI